MRTVFITFVRYCTLTEIKLIGTLLYKVSYLTSPNSINRCCCYNNIQCNTLIISHGNVFFKGLTNDSQWDIGFLLLVQCFAKCIPVWGLTILLGVKCKISTRFQHLLNLYNSSCIWKYPSVENVKVTSENSTRFCRRLHEMLNFDIFVNFPMGCSANVDFYHNGPRVRSVVL